ncbi:hypothetical protein ANCCAN_07126 [Ancylostoma caninum]|uniref:Uncharacterized protein n=1 Tax=Ancylostoma caninum TaxID=29170 RepID=A0A368GR08_ANCCA|nr:hypothetical protein ANCCAN_07126 [Ancylostoma caninum]
MGDSRRKRDVWRDCEAYSNSVGPRMEAGHESEYCMFYLCFSIIIALLPGLFAGNVAIGFNAQTITTTILLIVAICGAVGSLFRMSTPMLVLAITAVCTFFSDVYLKIKLNLKDEMQTKKR